MNNQICKCGHSYGEISEGTARNLLSLARIAKPEQVLEALGEVMSWIKNWEVDFLDDEEWDKTQTKVDKTLVEYKKAGEG